MSPIEVSFYRPDRTLVTSSRPSHDPAIGNGARFPQGFDRKLAPKRLRCGALYVQIEPGFIAGSANINPNSSLRYWLAVVNVLSGDETVLPAASVLVTWK